MSAGDVTISIAIEGGTTKAATFDSATRVKAKLYRTSIDNDLSVDADWQIDVINGIAAVLITQANQQLESETSYTPKTFTAAS